MVNSDLSIVSHKGKNKTLMRLIDRFNGQHINIDLFTYELATDTIALIKAKFENAVNDKERLKQLMKLYEPYLQKLEEMAAKSKGNIPHRYVPGDIDMKKVA